MADPGRMPPEERTQAHALLTRALSDPNWRAASQAPDDMMRKLLVVHRLLEAKEWLAKREPRGDRPVASAGVPQPRPVLAADGLQLMHPDSQARPSWSRSFGSPGAAQ